MFPSVFKRKLQEKAMSQKELSEITGMPISRINALVNEREKATLKEINLIASALTK